VVYNTLTLNRLADWLKEKGVGSVAMESTGVYWIPLYEWLEKRGFEVLLVHARMLSKVPGRKTGGGVRRRCQRRCQEEVSRRRCQGGVKEVSEGGVSPMI